ncbi:MULTISPECIES: hypothetical protein [unclassified Bradyrhizobium]
MLEKPDRDDQCELPDEPWPLLLQSVTVGVAAAAPGAVTPGGVVPAGMGSQLRRGISV